MYMYIDKHKDYNTFICALAFKIIPLSKIILLYKSMYICNYVY